MWGMFFGVFNFGQALCFLGFHRYDTKGDTGFTLYGECRGCGKRSYIQGRGGHQPSDREWLEGADKEPAVTDWSKRLPPRPTPPPPPGKIVNEYAARGGTVTIEYARSVDDMIRSFNFDPTEPDSIRGMVEGVRAFELAGLRTKSGMTAARSLDGLQGEVAEWTGRAFPHSTQQSRTRHLIREITEFAAHVFPTFDQEELEDLIAGEVGVQLNRIYRREDGRMNHSGDMLEELADCLLIMCDIAAHADPTAPHTTSLYLEAAAKLDRVKRRKYGTLDASGVSEHIRE